MPEMMHPAALEVEKLLKQCEIRRGRRSGPGGQHRNKVETAIVIRHRATEIRGEATERRSQEQNRQVAIARLRINLAIDVRCDTSRDATPSQLWQRRCAGGRVQINPQHDDFPAILAEALDFVAAFELDVKGAADHLTCSTSQLVKLLQKQPRAIQWINQERAARGLGRLR